MHAEELCDADVIAFDRSKLRFWDIFNGQIHSEKDHQCHIQILVLVYFMFHDVIFPHR